MNQSANQFIEKVTAQISFCEAHEEVILELRSHIQDTLAAADPLLPEAGSEQRAIEKLGDAEEIGQRLNLIHRDQTHWPLVISSGLLVLLGWYSLSTLNLGWSTGLWIALGLSAGGLLSRVRPGRLKSASWPVFIASMGVFALAYRWLGVAAADGLYLPVGPLNVNVAHLLLVPILVSLAGLIGRQFFAAALLTSLFAVLGLTLLFNSPSVFIYYFVSVLIMLVWAKAAKWMIGVFGFLTATFAWHGWRTAVAMATAAPAEENRHTDFILQHLQSHFPLLATGVLIIGGWMALQCWFLSLKLKGDYPRTLAVGLSTLFTINFAHSALTGLGVLPMPVNGVTVPLVSYGGTMLVGYLSLIGILVGLYRRKSLVGLSVKPAP